MTKTNPVYDGNIPISDRIRIAIAILRKNNWRIPTRQTWNSDGEWLERLRMAIIRMEHECPSDACYHVHGNPAEQAYEDKIEAASRRAQMRVDPEGRDV